MKTPMQELIERLNNVKPQDFCSIETIKGWAEEMLEKEKEAMCEFADQFAIECINFHHEKTMSQEQFFNLTFHHEEWFRKTFNTKEK